MALVALGVFLWESRLALDLVAIPFPVSNTFSKVIYLINLSWLRSNLNLALLFQEMGHSAFLLRNKGHLFQLLLLFLVENDSIILDLLIPCRESHFVGVLDNINNIFIVERVPYIEKIFTATSPTFCVTVWKVLLDDVDLSHLANS